MLWIRCVEEKNRAGMCLLKVSFPQCPKRLPTTRRYLNNSESEAIPQTNTVEYREDKEGIEVEKKWVNLSSLDYVADFSNQIYLKDEQSKRTAKTSSSDERSKS